MKRTIIFIIALSLMALVTVCAVNALPAWKMTRNQSMQDTYYLVGLAGLIGNGTLDWTGLINLNSSIVCTRANGFCNQTNTYTAGTGLQVGGYVFSVNTTWGDARWVTDSEAGGWDQNSSDDFDGAWSSLTSVPAGFSDDEDNDTTYSAGSGLSLSSAVFSHNDSSSQASVDSSDGTVVQDLDLDWAGHLIGVTSYNLDNRYYTESEADSLLASQDACSEIAGCVVGAITSEVLWIGNYSGYNKTGWDVAYGWGDHGVEGYLTTEALWSGNSSTVARIGVCGAGDFVQNVTVSGVECTTPAGGGDITAVYTNDLYLYNGSATSDVFLRFNNTKLDAAIAASGGDNATWNQSGADALYYAISNPWGFINTSTLSELDPAYHANALGFYNTTTLPAYSNLSDADIGTMGYIKTYTETDPLWSGNESLVYFKTNDYSFYNSSTLVEDDYHSNPLSYLNSSTVNYYTAADAASDLQNSTILRMSTQVNVTSIYLNISAAVTIRQFNSTCNGIFSPDGSSRWLICN